MDKKKRRREEDEAEDVCSKFVEELDLPDEEKAPLKAQCDARLRKASPKMLYDLESSCSRLVDDPDSIAACIGFGLAHPEVKLAAFNKEMAQKVQFCLTQMDKARKHGDAREYGEFCLDQVPEVKNPKDLIKSSKGYGPPAFDHGTFSSAIPDGVNDLGSAGASPGNSRQPISPTQIKTVRFRLFPTERQIPALNEIFTIYNRVKRSGYQMRFNGESDIQQKLMRICRNNPYVNTILIENTAKLQAQETWLKKMRKYIEGKIEVIQDKINDIKGKDKRDRRLRGLFAKLSSLQNKLRTLKLKPVTFGTKGLFKNRSKGKLTREEFRIRRDASFVCIGKAQGGVKNLNLKILPGNELRIATFKKEKGNRARKIIIPFSANTTKQKAWLQEIDQADKYTVCVKRQITRGDIRYYMYVSYEIPAPTPKHGFGNGAIGLDFNYDFVSLTNVDARGRLLSYQTIKFRNLHSYRKNRRADYASYKMDKVVNYCIHKRKGLVIEDLSFNQSFSYNKKLNRKLSNFKTSMLEILERKCTRKGVAIRRVHPAYTSIIGRLKYSRSYNLSVHHLASYVIARRGLGFQELLPPLHKWLLSQVGGVLKPRLKQGSPYRDWAKLHDLFKHCGITSFRPPEIMKKVSVKYGLNPATGARPDNLRTGLPFPG
ncbi:MAG: IS200/IS605 family element transposase accessory protein TnpB [Candidatus Helarchaeota archaeon]|nr:IS200/IS605 family element transposase accessory protein TnpB [Candidatus Helarchaeota archaeon]